MKNIVYIILCSLTFPVFARAGIARDTAAIEKVKILLDETDAANAALFSDIYQLHDGKAIGQLPALKIKCDLDTLAAKQKELVSCLNSLGPLSPKTQADYFLYLNNFRILYQQMTERINVLASNLQAIYSAQIDYTGNGITAFATTIGNLRSFVLSLTPDHTLEMINEKVAHTDKDVNDDENTLNNAAKIRDQGISNKVDLTAGKVDAILKLLKPKTNSSRQLELSFYSQALFGIACLQKISYDKDLNYTGYLGAEVMIPIASPKYRGHGVFLLNAIGYDRWYMEAGAGYLKEVASAEDISWKIGVSFSPGPVGIGLDYSPVTGAGVKVGWAW